MKIESNFLGKDFDSPFILASAPPTANADMMARAFEKGWSGAVIKTLTKDPVINLKNRFATLRVKNKIMAFSNFELVSEIKSDQWFKDIEKLKRNFPQKVVIGSIMGDAHEKSTWIDLAYGLQDAGVDFIELNFSCPHGYPEKGKGAAIGQDARYSKKITAWLKQDEKIKIPIIPKLTAAVSNISYIGESVSEAGADGLSAINTYPSLMGFDLKNLKPKASVNGISTPGGYSGIGLRPIALKAIHDLYNNPGLPIMAGGGIGDGFDAVEFMLLGAPIVQVCTAVMLEGINIINKLKSDLRNFMSMHSFNKISDFLGIGSKMIQSYSSLNKDYSILAKIDKKKCTGCQKCFISCTDAAFQAISMNNNQAQIDSSKCTGCSLCYNVCPTGSINMGKMQSI